MVEHTRCRSAAHIDTVRNTCTIYITVIIVEWHNRIQAVVDADKRQSMHGERVFTNRAGCVKEKLNVIRWYYTRRRRYHRHSKSNP